MTASDQGVLNAQWNAVVEQSATAIAARAPSVLFRPKLFPDGNKWCALYGADLQEGCAGFGDSPEEAMAEFDKAWREKISSPKTGTRVCTQIVVGEPPYVGYSLPTEPEWQFVIVTPFGVYAYSRPHVRYGNRDDVLDYVTRKAARGDVLAAAAVTLLRVVGDVPK